MVAFLEEEEAKLHERRLKERSNIQGLEVHGKSPGIAPETALPSPRWGRGRKSRPSRHRRIATK